MLVIRKQYFGLGTALSNRKSVHPSVKIVSSPSSSATGPSAGVLALEMTPVNRSILASSFIRRSSLTLASVPAASSAVMVSILRLPNSPPWALISSAAMLWPLIDGSPSTAAALVRNVMWPILNGVSGIFPLAGSWAALSICEPPTKPAPARPAPPTVTPNVLRKARRFTVGVFSMKVPPFGKADRFLATRPNGADTTASYPAGTGVIAHFWRGQPPDRRTRSCDRALFRAGRRPLLGPPGQQTPGADAYSTTLADTTLAIGHRGIVWQRKSIAGRPAVFRVRRPLRLLQVGFCRKPDERQKAALAARVEGRV